MVHLVEEVKRIRKFIRQQCAAQLWPRPSPFPSATGFDSPAATTSDKMEPEDVEENLKFHYKSAESKVRDLEGSDMMGLLWAQLELISWVDSMSTDRVGSGWNISENTETTPYKLHAERIQTQDHQLCVDNFMVNIFV